MNRVVAGISLPDLIRTKAANHMVRLERVTDLRALELAQERAEGFVEGLEAARALTPINVEALYVAIEVAVAARRQGMAP